MAEHVTIAKAKPVEAKVGQSGREIREAYALASHMPRSPGELARNNAFSTFEAKRRKGFADAGHPEWAGQRDWMSSGEDYKPPMAPADIPADAGKGALSGVFHLPDLFGQLGDIPDMRYDLARKINRMVSGSPGGNMTADKAISAVQDYDPLHYIPHTEDVANKVTTPMYDAAGATWLNYQPQSPWGGAANVAPSLVVDPFHGAGRGVSAGAKLINMMKKAAR